MTFNCHPKGEIRGETKLVKEKATKFTKKGADACIPAGILPAMPVRLGLTASRRKHHFMLQRQDGERGLSRRMARRAQEAARRRKGTHSSQRRTRETAPGTAVGPARQRIPLRDRRRQRLARRSFPKKFPASRLPFHVRPRLPCRLSGLLVDR